MLEHFRAPRNVGRVDRPSGTGRAENQACGDQVDLSVRLVSGRIEEARFLCQGCSAAIGAASYLTEILRGQSLARALALDADQLLQKLGETRSARRHGMVLAVRAARRALKEAGAGI
ncbi:MAG: iron-sulfur cluster assembly scaffold protein [Planctomycetota bacterium]